MATLREQAIELASRGYHFTVTPDVTDEGGTVMFIECVELVGCVAQGSTIQEALAEFNEAKIDYIESCLEDGLDVPSPYSVSGTTTTNWSSVSVETTFVRSAANPGATEVNHTNLAEGFVKAS